MSVHPGHSVISGIVGVICAVLGTSTNGAWGDILLWIGVLLLAYALAVLLAWLAFQAAEVRSDFVRANAWDIECAVLHERRGLSDSVRNLNEEQCKIVIENGLLGVSFRLFDDEPLVYPTSVPYWFLYEFIEKSDEMFLCQVRNYSEGTNQRKWAQDLTRLFISRGEATQAGGNLQARWKSPQIFEQYKLLAKHEETQPPLRESVTV